MVKDTILPNNNKGVNLFYSDVTYFESVKSVTGINRDLESIFKEIGSGKHKEIVSRIRLSQSKEERTYLKSQLPAVTFSGTFSKRNKDFCTSASGFACLDFDKLQDIELTKGKLIESRFCAACFTSPSGNGLKVLIKIPLVISDKSYKEYYGALLEHYSKFDPDNSTKDISRLCFLSFDKGIYLNHKSEVFTKRLVAPKRIARVSMKTANDVSISEGETLRRLFNWWSKNHWDSSARNNSLYKLAATLCEFGITEETTWSIVRTYEASDLTERELLTLMKSAYKRVVFNSKTLSND